MIQFLEVLILLSFWTNNRRESLSGIGLFFSNKKGCTFSGKQHGVFHEYDLNLGVGW